MNFNKYIYINKGEYLKLGIIPSFYLSPLKNILGFLVLGRTKLP